MKTLHSDILRDYDMKVLALKEFDSSFHLTYGDGVSTAI